MFARTQADGTLLSMWFLSIAWAQECTVQSVVAGFPLGTVPTTAQTLVIARSDCPHITAEALVSDGEQTWYRRPVTPEQLGDLWLFPFTVDPLPDDVELLFEVTLAVEGEPRLILGGVYRVDPDNDDHLDGRPQLADLRMERIDEHVFEISAAVLPATTAPEALILWRVDGVLLEATVSTQPRPSLHWTQEDPTQEEVCIEVEEIGVDGQRAASEPRCFPLAQEGCSCGQPSPGFSSLFPGLLRRR